MSSLRTDYLRVFMEPGLSRDMCLCAAPEHGRVEETRLINLQLESHSESQCKNSKLCNKSKSHPDLHDTPVGIVAHPYEKIIFVSPILPNMWSTKVQIQAVSVCTSN